MTYEQARAEVEAALGPDNGLDVRFAKALRTLLAGPSEPAEEDVYAAIAMQGTERLTPRANALEAARRIQQLYRSRHG